MFGFKKKNQLLESVKKEIHKLVKEDFEIKYMIVPKRTLKVSSKFLINELVKFSVLNWWNTSDKLLSLNNYVNQKKIDFIYTTSLKDELLVKCFDIKYISDALWNIWENIDLKLDILPHTTTSQKKIIHYRITQKTSREKKKR